ncbi:MAG: hypothetical protein AB7E79_05645 [Rhodospirillaceae bacterium]
MVNLPGHLPYDGIVVWWEGRHGVHFSQHPIALALLWRLADAAGLAPGGITAIQLGILWLAAYLLVRATHPHAALAFAFYAALLLWPAFFATSALGVKDVLGGHLLILAAVIAFAGPHPLSARGLAVVMILATLAVLFRAQFAVVWLVLAAALTWRNWSSPIAARLVRSATVATIGTAAVAGVMASLTFTIGTRAMPDPPHAGRKIMVYDIAGVLASRPTAPLPTFAAHGVDLPAFRSDVRELYTPERVDWLWRPEEATGGAFVHVKDVPNAALFSQWRDAALEEPAAFLLHRVRAFARVLGFGDIYGCIPVMAGVSALPADLAREVGAGRLSAPLSLAVVKHRYFPANSPAFYAWVYAIAACALLIGFAARRPPFFVAFAAGAALLYELSFFAAPQACDVRYSYYLMMAVAFGSAALVFDAARRVEAAKR